MDLTMTVAEREQFLASDSASRNGVLSIAEPDGGVIASPVWFVYAPGADIGVHLTDPSRKLTALRAAGRATLTVQDEGDVIGSGRPPRYVSVTGPVVEDRPAELERDGDELWASMVKYLGEERGARYVEYGGESFLLGTEPELPRIVRLRPTRWFTRDYSKAGVQWDELVGVPGASLH